MAIGQRMIEPFEPNLVSEGVVSFGLSSYGYDVRLADEFKALDPSQPETAPLDPKAASASHFVDTRASTFVLKPGQFVLGRTVEYLRIPPNVLTICAGKSSYARCGIIVNVTPFEPGWEGYATLCIVNAGPRPVRLHAGEGIAQILFFESDEQCQVTYANRQGKYQAQQEITVSRLG
jgi:dCTP deaminase